MTTIEKLKETAQETCELLESMTATATELARWWHLRGFSKDAWMRFAASVWRAVERAEEEKRKAGKA